MEGASKEVEEGMPKLPQGDGLRTENNKSVATSTTDEHDILFKRVKLKGMVWRLVEGIFKSIKLEEIKQRLRALLKVASHFYID